MTDLLIGRQPIFDRSMNVYAYELLYRSDQNNQAVFSNGDQATMQVILNAMVEIGLENIVGDSKAFINLENIASSIELISNKNSFLLLQSLKIIVLKSACNSKV